MFSISEISSSCLTLPLVVYDNLLANHGDSSHQKFFQLISDVVSTQSDQIPIINETSLDLIPDGHLVRVYGMVQDTFGVELFMDEFNMAGDKERRPRSFRFRDFGSDELSCGEPENVKFGERHSAYVVPVPGESVWVRQARASKCKYTPAVQLIGTKRSIEDNEELPTEPKKAKGPANENTASKPKPGKQFPLSEEEEDESRVGVLVRFYQADQDALKINEIVEVYGILEHARLGSVMLQDEFSPDAKGSDPIPRVHAVIIKHHQHNNPCLMDSGLIPSLSSISEPSTALFAHVDHSLLRSTRSVLRAVLLDCFQGDALAAEYALIHLASTRFTVDSPYPTKLPALNIVCPIADEENSSSGSKTICTAGCSNLFKRLETLLRNLVTQLAPINLNLESLNTGPNLIPVRDANRGALDTGRLQLPSGTQVLVDETKMTTGQLQSRGVLNLRALTMLATKQCVPYDFQFYTQDWDTDCRVMIVSTGPSLIKPTLILPWLPDVTVSVGENVANHSDPRWTEMRNFLTILAQSSAVYSMQEGLEDRINDDFVKWRRSKTTFIEGDDLAVMLCLLRTLCLTYGETSATVERWEQVCRMEEERRGRMKKS